MQVAVASLDSLAPSTILAATQESTKYAPTEDTHGADIVSTSTCHFDQRRDRDI